MPSIPQYNTRQVKTDAAATPYYKTQASAEAFGAGTAKALQSMGEKMGDASSAVGKILIAKADAKKEAEEKASDAAEKQVNETLAVDYSNQFIQATQPKLDHYFGQRGKGAVEGFDAAATQLSQAKEDLLSQAPVPGVADMLSPALEGELNASLSQLQRHRDQQQGVYEDDVSAMRIGLSQEKANRAYNDDRAVATNFHIAASEQAHQLQRRGASPEEQATAQADLASSFLRGRIESALGNNDLPAAQRYYAAAGAGLNAADQAPVKARLDAAVLTDTVQRHTQQILQAPVPMPRAAPSAATTAAPAGSEVGMAVPDGPRPPDLQARLAEVMKIADPAVRDRVEVNVALATEREAAAYRDNQRQLKAQAKQILDQGGDLGAIPYDTLAGMDQAGRAGLTAYAKAGGRVASDPVVFYRLQNQALDHPQAFLDADLHDHLGNLDAKDFAALSQLQDKLRKGQTSGEDDPQLSLLRSYKANTDLMLQGLGLPTGSAEAAEATSSGLYRQAASLRRDIDLQVAAQEAATGRKLTSEEQQQLLVRMVVQQSAAAMVTQPANDNASADESSDGAKPSDTKALPIVGSLAGSATLPAVAASGAVAEWASTALAVLSRAALTAAGVGGPLASFFFAMTPTSTAGPELDMLPQPARQPNLDDLRNSKPGPAANLDELQNSKPGPAANIEEFGDLRPGAAPNVDEFSDPAPGPAPNLDGLDGPMESSTSRRNKKKVAIEAAKARGEVLPKKESWTPASDLLPDDKRDPKDRRDNIPFKEFGETLNLGDWIDISKFTKRIPNRKLTTFEDPETGYYIERDKGGHSDKIWKLRSPLQKRIGSVTRFGKVLSK